MQFPQVVAMVPELTRMLSAQGLSDLTTVGQVSGKLTLLSSEQHPAAELIFILLIRASTESNPGLEEDSISQVQFLPWLLSFHC